MFGLTGWQLVLGALGLGVGALLFQAGCALADLNGPGWLRSLGALVVALLLCLPLGWVLVHLAGRYDSDPGALLGPFRVLALAVVLPAAWLVAAAVFSAFLRAPFRKGLVVAGAELVLGALVASLATAAVLIFLAAMQIARQQPTRGATGPAVPDRVGRL
jgi:hypothetical protein